MEYLSKETRALPTLLFVRDHELRRARGAADNGQSGIRGLGWRLSWAIFGLFCPLLSTRHVQRFDLAVEKLGNKELESESN